MSIPLHPPESVLARARVAEAAQTAKGEDFAKMEEAEQESEKDQHTTRVDSMAAKLKRKE